MEQDHKVPRKHWLEAGGRRFPASCRGLKWQWQLIRSSINAVDSERAESGLSGTAGRGASAAGVRMAGSTAWADTARLPGVAIGDRRVARTGIDGPRIGERRAARMSASSLASAAYRRHYQGSDGPSKGEAAEMSSSNRKRSARMRRLRWGQEGWSTRWHA